jgi:uncharacterized protein with HEPN domain
MKQRDARAWLHDASVACGHIREFTSGLTFDDYASRPMVQSAVERQFQIIGEALNLLAQSEPALATRITDCRKIIAFRNRLTHAYVWVSHEVVWGVLEEHLALLETEVRGLLAELS